MGRIYEVRCTVCGTLHAWVPYRYSGQKYRSSLRMQCVKCGKKTLMQRTMSENLKFQDTRKEPI